MSDYTPTTADVFECYDWWRDFYPRARAEFDRWLASVKAEAWDEGHATPRELEPFDGHTFTAVNPYREASK